MSSFIAEVLLLAHGLIHGGKVREGGNRVRVISPESALLNLGRLHQQRLRLLIPTNGLVERGDVVHGGGVLMMVVAV
eukprot:CAMPEP_0115880570 /NCGR_PEP_ID=MMETSP0287-20121206/27951_1 /TAXON_ID=412157 /ORGANISM="Chrysochromulina rotalis, Strain UIO044" /LENGTH=76 /DNA_ID=CAMNT_0003336409 /DNA_START=364 /DNA_END=591 /DNA_ORIENTATION=-